MPFLARGSSRPAMEAWEIGGLHLTPEISAVDASGAELSAPYLQDLSLIHI